MNIKDKLRQLDKSSSSAAQNETVSIYCDDFLQDFENELNVKILHEKNSLIVLKENYYPLYTHPFSAKTRDNGYYLANFHRITLEPAAEELNLSRTAFIDLETTGLSGGTGTYAFLIGLGHIELNQIVVRQYLLPDFQYEWLLLKQVENVLKSFDTIVTFNGKSFDIPLLRNRFILNRMDSILDDLLHIDILHSVRRLWKTRLSSCDLGNVEYAILGQQRLNDIPGEMIPQIYFEYIRKRRVYLLRDVLEHNYYDIANLVLLTIYIGQVVDNPLEILTEEQDIYSLARFYYQNKNYLEAIPLLENLYQKTNKSNLFTDAIFLLSMSYKKLGQHQQSSKFFQQLLRTRRDHTEAIEELAKYYEHREKNYEAALELVNLSIENATILEQLGKYSPVAEIKGSLYYRKKRLERKLARNTNDPSE
jgi:uncharacterized protein YprB with RNaseH-like and TPR domain